MLESGGEKNNKMSYVFKTISYRDICMLSDLIQGVYRKYHININPSSYVAKYIKSARLLFESWSNRDKTITQDREKFAEILEESLECLRLGMAIKWIKDKPNLQEQLRHLLKGSIAPFSNDRTEAKDFAFQLNVAAHLEAIGGNIALVEPDVRFTFKGLSLAVACKNLYSEGNIEKNIRKARKQIIKSKQSGLIAVSIDALVNHVDMMNANNENEVCAQMDHYLTSFVEAYEDILPAWIDSKKILGLIVSLSVLTKLKAKNLPSYAHLTVVNNMCSIRSPYFNLLVNLVQTLNKHPLSNI